MAYRADDIIDRRRLRRKLTFWRIAALAIAALGVAALASWVMGDRFGGAAIDHIARVKIEGTITENEELLKRLERITESDRVKGVVLSIDSPGGPTAGGESIYLAVREMVRVLRPGGRLMLQDLDGQLIWHEPMDDALRSGLDKADRTSVV